MEYRNIKRKLAEAPKYSTLTGKEPAVCHPVRLKHIGEDILYVRVRAVCSVNEVTFVRRDVSPDIDGLWEKIVADMNMFYRENLAQLKPVATLEKDRLYAVELNGMWTRVVFCDFNEAGDAKLEIVDEGYFETVSPSAVFPLECRFGIFPCQSTRCVLYDLQHFSFVLSKLVFDAVTEHLLDEMLNAVIISREPNLTVVFFKPPELNLNEFILLQVAKHVWSIPPKDDEKDVPEDPLMNDPCISYRIKASLLDNLLFFMAIKRFQLPPTSEVTADGLYLGNNAKGRWFRMRLESNIPESADHRKVKVRLIDYGNSVEIVPRNCLWDLNSMSPVIAAIPNHEFVVLPLSCLCARVVSMNEIDLQSAPSSVQSFVCNHIFPF